MPAAIPIPPDLEPELRQRLSAGDGLDSMLAWLRGRGWPGGRSALAARLAVYRERPADQVRAAMEEQRGAASADPPTAEQRQPETPQAEPAAAGALAPPRDTLTELREARELLRDVSRQAVQEMKRGNCSPASARQAVESYISASIKIHKLEKAEQGPQKRYKIVEARLPAKEEMQ